MLSRTLRRTSLATALSCAIAGGALAPAAAQDMPFDSTIKFAKGPPALNGKVKSANPECVVDRKVRLFVSRQGEDKLLGKTRTDEGGRWQIPIKLKSGAYYAKVNDFARETPQLVCLSDRSKKLLVNR